MSWLSWLEGGEWRQTTGIWMEFWTTTYVPAPRAAVWQLWALYFQLIAYQPDHDCTVTVNPIWNWDYIHSQIVTPTVQSDKNLSISWNHTCTNHKCLTRGIKEYLLSRKSSWQAGTSRLMKLKPRVGRQHPLFTAGLPGVKPCSMLLLPAPSRPRTRTWRFPRSSSSCEQRSLWKSSQFDATSEACKPRHFQLFYKFSAPFINHWPSVHKVISVTVNLLFVTTHLGQIWGATQRQTAWTACICRRRVVLYLHALFAPQMPQSLCSRQSSPFKKSLKVGLYSCRVLLCVSMDVN